MPQLCRIIELIRALLLQSHREWGSNSGGLFTACVRRTGRRRFAAGVSVPPGDPSALETRVKLPDRCEDAGVSLHQPVGRKRVIVIHVYNRRRKELAFRAETISRTQD